MMLAVAAVVIVLPTVAMIVAYLFRRLESQERIRAIEQGHLLSFEPREIALRTRRSGIVMIMAGVGILIGITVAASKLGSEVLSGLGFGILPALIGVGLLIDYALQLRRLQK